MRKVRDSGRDDLRSTFMAHTRKSIIKGEQLCLSTNCTQHLAGMALWGDFAALERLREFINHIVEESDYIDHKEDFVLGLAYDVRKAFLGQRSQDFRGYSEK